MCIRILDGHNTAVVYHLNINKYKYPQLKRTTLGNNLQCIQELLQIMPLSDEAFFSKSIMTGT